MGCGPEKENVKRRRKRKPCAPLRAIRRYYHISFDVESLLVKKTGKTTGNRLHFHAERHRRFPSCNAAPSPSAQGVSPTPFVEFHLFCLGFLSLDYWRMRFIETERPARVKVLTTDVGWIFLSGRKKEKEDRSVFSAIYCDMLDQTRPAAKISSSEVNAFRR